MSYVGSNPTLCNFSTYVGTAGFVSWDIKSQNKLSDKYKVSIVMYILATVVIQLDGKHIGFMPDLKSEGYC